MSRYQLRSFLTARRKEMDLFLLLAERQRKLVAPYRLQALTSIRSKLTRNVKKDMDSMDITKLCLVTNE